jgi:heat shock protein HslJ
VIHSGAGSDEHHGRWVLQHGWGPDEAVPVLADHPITLVIEADRWSGKAPCNTYTAVATVDEGRVTLPPAIATTLMACLDDGVMEAERAYLDAFARVDGLLRAGDRLVLRGPGVELVYGPGDTAAGGAPGDRDTPVARGPGQGGGPGA